MGVHTRLPRHITFLHMNLVWALTRSLPDGGGRCYGARVSDATAYVIDLSSGEFRDFSPCVDKTSSRRLEESEWRSEQRGPVDARRHLGGSATAASRLPGREGLRHLDRPAPGDHLGGRGARGGSTEHLRTRLDSRALP